MQTIVRKVSLLAFDQIERSLRDLHGSPVELQETWYALHAFFAEAPTKEDAEYRWTFFRIYTEITWKLFSAQEREVIVDIAFPRQVPMALLLDFDVWTNLMWFFATRTIDENDLKSIYNKIKDSFLTSPALLGKWQGKDVTVQEIVEEIKKTKNKTATTLDKANILTRIKNVMFPKDDPALSKYVIADQETAVDRFVDLVNFFLDVEPDDIQSVVDMFVNPELDGMAPAVTSKEVEPIQKESKQTPRGNIVKESAPKPTLKFLQSQILKQFANQTGQIQNVEGVLKTIDEMAKKYNDPKIRELYYFDEKASAFQWNEKLLAG